MLRSVCQYRSEACYSCAGIREDIVGRNCPPRAPKGPFPAPIQPRHADAEETTLEPESHRLVMLPPATTTRRYLEDERIHLPSSRRALPETDLSTRSARDPCRRGVMGCNGPLWRIGWSCGWARLPILRRSQRERRARRWADSASNLAGYSKLEVHRSLKAAGPCRPPDFSL